jgi:hypothetical protein
LIAASAVVTGVTGHRLIPFHFSVLRYFYHAVLFHNIFMYCGKHSEGDSIIQEARKG